MLNPYFSAIGEQSEQDLLDDLLIEQIQMFGMLVKYLPRTLMNEDPILGEDPSSKFTKVYPIEMYMDNFAGWNGEGNLLSKFGMEFRKFASFTVSRRRFDQELRLEGNQPLPVTSPSSIEVRPMEGDLIYLPLSNTLFEITKVDHESQFYEWGGRYTWKMDVEKFRYSSEEISTGDLDIDKIATEHQNNGTIANDPIADNLNITNAKTGIIDTSEDNPFGVP